jgi:cell wall assembly regulator SMI1/ribosomal protein S13
MLTPGEHEAAIARAADARRARNELREKLRAGAVSLKYVLDNAYDDDAVGRMKVLAVLESLPGVGTAEARRALEDLGIAGTRRVRSLAEDACNGLLQRFAPSEGVVERRRPQAVGRIAGVDKIQSAMHELGSAFVAGLTQSGSMLAVRRLRGTHRLRRPIRGGETRTYDAAGNPAYLGRSSDGLNPALFDFASLVGSGKDVALAVELSGTSSGDYTVSYTTELASLPPTIVLDDDHRFPHHPPRGMRRPPGAVNDLRPIDQDVLSDVQSLVAEFVERYTDLRGQPPLFPPGYDEAEILAAEEQLGVRLPEDLRALYRTIKDDSQESGLLGHFSLATLEKVLTWHQADDPGWYARDDAEPFAYDPVVYETYPYGHVRRLSHNDWWVPFAEDHAGNFAAVDLDPAELGRDGQVLGFGRDVWGPVAYGAPSIRHLMRIVLAHMRRARPDDGDWNVEDWLIPNHEWTVDVADASLVDLVAALPDPSLVQFVHLRRVDQLRLQDLARLDHLRSIRVLDARQKAQLVDLSIPPNLPIEHVHVVAERFDPQALAATPTINYITVAGNTEPVSVAALAELPNLLRLDLAAAAIADIGSIATFPTIRVLTLNPQQWEELMSTGWTPELLAAAELAGHADLAHIAAWTSTIRGDDHPAIHLHTVRGRRA